MKLLLDTHAFLWFIRGDQRLHDHARSLIEDTNNARYLSIASVWEITIKASLGKLEVPLPPSLLVREYVWANNIKLLSLSPEQFDLLLTLPKHHKDPFDRLLISQAMHEDLAIVTNDQEIRAYGIAVEWASTPE